MPVQGLAAQYSMGLTVRDQLTKTELRPSIIVRVVESKAYNLGNDVVCFTGLFFGKASLSIFWAREAGSRVYPFLDGHRRTAHGIGSRYESLLYCRRDEHHPSSNVARTEDIGR
jgi:hypothetical protein